MCYATARVAPAPRIRAPMLLSLPTTPLASARSAAPTPIAVLASGRGSNLAAICAAIDAGELDARVALVICNVEGAGVIARAHALGVACCVIPHRGFPGGRAAHDAAVADAVEASGARWIIMAGWMRIATSALLDRFPDRILNLHPSLLPAFRGRDPQQQALDAGARITGCTVHIVTEALDAGPIVAQAAVIVDPDDNVESLSTKIQAAEHLLYPLAIQALLSQTHTG